MISIDGLFSSLYTQRMEKSPSRWWDLPSAFFLFALILLASWRLEATNWVDGLNHVRTVAVLGLLTGLALGKSLFQRRTVILLAIGYMVVFFIWQLLGFIDFPREQGYLGDQLLILSGRLWVSLRDYVTGIPVSDPLLFIAMLSIPYWFVGIFSGYQLVRHVKTLISILPSGILMLIIHLNHYTQTDYTWLFAIYVFMALILMSRQKFLLDKSRWQQERVLVSSESSLDINNTTMIVAAAVIVAAWVVPLSLPLTAQAREAWREWFGERQQADEVFTFLNREPVPAAPTNLLQTELTLGTEASQGTLVEFLVYAPAAARTVPRLYWRGYVYDVFEDGRWQISETDRVSFVPQDGEFDLPRWSQRRNLTFTFDMYEKGQRVIYTPSQPLWTNYTANILYHAISVEDDDLVDIMALQATPALLPGDVYRVTSLLADPAIAELQGAGEEYPDWILERYLQLPDEFSPRIRELALEITSEYETPYDKAAAITEWLRSEIEYTPVMSFPQESVDALEYFLFESKQGFCNYYASAEVLMLRSIGIPARLAVGFSQGELDLQNTLYTVRERDYHAWPEVYFPDYGWVEFEPTGNQEPIERQQIRVDRAALTPTPLAESNIPGLLDEELESAFTDTDDTNQITAQTRSLILQIGIPVGIILLVILAFFLKKRYAPTFKATTALKTAIERNGWNVPVWLTNWLSWSTAPPIERHFQSINLSLRWMGKPQPVHVTAAERAALLQTLLPSAAESIGILLHEHQSSLFSPRGGDEVLTRRASRRIINQTLANRIKTGILGYNKET